MVVQRERWLISAKLRKGVTLASADNRGAPHPAHARQLLENNPDDRSESAQIMRTI